MLEHEPRGVELRDDVRDALPFGGFAAIFNLFRRRPRKQRDSVRDGPRAREGPLPHDAHGGCALSSSSCSAAAPDEEVAQQGAEGHRGGEGGSRGGGSSSSSCSLPALVIISVAVFVARARGLLSCLFLQQEGAVGPDHGQARQRHLAQLRSRLFEDFRALEELGAVERALRDDLEET